MKGTVSGSVQATDRYSRLSYRETLLKVPKCEIFDHSDFQDFYSMKSLREGDFGVKIKNSLKNIQGFIWGRAIPYAYARSNFKESSPFRT
jgi:hypothetical protein